MLTYLPYALIYSRVLLALAIGWLAVNRAPQSTGWIIVLMVVGLLTDIFDGIIARNIGVSTQRLRLLDSNVDQFFWLVTIGAIFYLNLSFVLDHWFWIAMVLLLEIGTYVVSYVRFSKPVATHTIMAKIWTLSLLAFLIDLQWNATSSLFFGLCIGLGILSRFEIMGILVRLTNWANDVPTIFSVKKINDGTPIKRNKFFNG